MSRAFKTIFSLLLFVIAYYFYPYGSVVKAGASDNIKVVDGDSLEIGSTRIRLLGIDSPEYKQYCYDKKHKKYSCGIKAKKYLEDIVKSGDVECKEQSKDRYKRSLSVCYVNGVDINEKMVRSGWAVSYRDEGIPYKEAEFYAKKEKAGIWQGKFMRPELYRFAKKKKNS